MKIAVLLSGCGVYDGAEIQESVLSLLAIENEGHQAQCFSLNQDQFHVINHLNGEEMSEKRNMMIEAARIARGNIKEISDINIKEFDALLIPGGFGSAKNFSNWAFKGTESNVNEKIKKLIIDFHDNNKIIIALCVSPVLLAKTFENSSIHLSLSLGSSTEKSPYNINDFHNGLKSLGSNTIEKGVNEILIDKENRIITAPCYMMEANISEIYKAISLAVKGLKEF